MAWASTVKVILGCIAFAIWWVFAVFPAIPYISIGRTAGSLVGATLMVVFQVITPNEAFEAVDLPILGLLFGTMVVSVYLERAKLFKYLTKALSWRTKGGKDLLCRVCLLAALSSALFTNDTSCVVLTGFVLELCRRENLHPKPFLIALASSSNIGSAATPIGNPQNLVIAINSKISFGNFLSGVFPAVAVGLVVNTILLLAVYGCSLSRIPLPVVHLSGQHAAQSSELGDLELSSVDVRPQSMTLEQTGDTSEHREAREKSPANQSPAQLDGQNGGIPPQTGDRVGEIIGDSLERGGREVSDFGGSQQGSRHIERIEDSTETSCTANVAKCGWILQLLRKSPKKHWQKARVYLVTLGMLAAFLAGLSLPWTAISAAVLLMTLDRSDAGPSLEKVSYSLLVFFSGMFIATSGFNKTGAPEEFWLAVEPHSRIDNASGVGLLSLVVTVLSNVASNVPTVLLLGPRVAASASATPGASADKAWLILAWVSTVAGNLTLVGSAANLIVCEQARLTSAEKLLREEQSNNLSVDLQGSQRATYNLSFWNHLKFGFPSTLIVIAAGLVPIVIRKF